MWRLALVLAGCGRIGFDPSGASDAPAPADAGADAPAGSTVESWGEEPTADHTSVTSDTWLSDKLSPDERGLNFGRSNRLDLDEDAVALLRFDLAAAAGKRVYAAALRLSVSSSRHDAIVLRRVLEPWTEGNSDGIAGAASWNERVAGTAWTTPGARPPGSAGAIVGTIASGASGNVTVALDPATVQAWIDAPATNFGIVATVSDADDTDLGASEASGGRPQLTITFLP